MRRREFLQAGAMLAASGSASAWGLQLPRKRFARHDRPDQTTQFSRAVRVAAAPLVFTGQLAPPDDALQGDAGEQATALATELSYLLSECSCDGDGIAKLNLYVASDADVPAVRTVFSEIILDAHPALTLIAGKLPADDRVRVMADVIAASNDEAPAGAVRTPPADSSKIKPAKWAMLPIGPKVFISGQAAGGEFEPAVTATIRELAETLAFMGLDWRHVAQLKAFYQPAENYDALINAIVETVGGDHCPPVVAVEWRDAGPVEIEVAAYSPPGAGPPATGEFVEFFAPPKLKPSPVFSRIARTHAGELIFIGGLTSGKTGDATTETRDVLEQLREVAEANGSDLKHLAKATYYVTDAEATKALGALRPEFYDPARPPAASRASVRSVCQPGRRLLIDMVATPSG